MATTKYCYDGTDLIYEDDDDGGHREYYHGPEGLLSMYDSAGGGSRRYHFYDGMGSTSELTNESGTELGTYTYDAWGSQLSGPALTNPFRYIGKHGYYANAADGMYLLQQRYYRTSIGRFWTKVRASRIKDGEPAYGYAANNPTAYDDPTGLLPRTKNPNCCANNLPGEMKGGKCEPRGTDPQDPRHYCWITRCQYCSISVKGSGFNKGIGDAVDDLIGRVTGGGPRLCYKVSRCIGVCPHSLAINLGLGQYLPGAGHGGGPLLGTGCCVQTEVDLRCAFYDLNQFGENEACRPQNCTSNGKTGVPGLRPLPRGKFFLGHKQSASKCLDNVITHAGYVFPFPL